MEKKDNGRIGRAGFAIEDVDAIGLNAMGGGSRPGGISRCFRRCCQFYSREENIEALGHGGVSENGIAQGKVCSFGHHCHLYHGHDLAGLCTDHREAENASVGWIEQGFHEAMRFTDGSGAKDGSHRNPGGLVGDAPALRLGFERPMCATWGSVNRQEGMSRSLVERLPPARLSRMIRKSSSEA